MYISWLSTKLYMYSVDLRAGDFNTGSLNALGNLVTSVVLPQLSGPSTMMIGRFLSSMFHLLLDHQSTSADMTTYQARYTAIARPNPRPNSNPSFMLHLPVPLPREESH